MSVSMRVIAAAVSPTDVSSILPNVYFSGGGSRLLRRQDYRV